MKIKNIPEKIKTKMVIEDGQFKQKKLDIMRKPNKERTIVIPIDNMGKMNINFRGGRYCFDFKELLEFNHWPRR